MGTPQRPITIDEEPFDFGAPPTMTSGGGLVLESLRERMERVERGQGFKNKKRGDGTKVKSEDLGQTDPRPVTSDRPVTEMEEMLKREARGETDAMEVDDAGRDLGVSNPTGPLFNGPTAATATKREEAAGRAGKLERRRKLRLATELLYSDANKLQDLLKNRLSDPSERAAFDLAVLEKVEELKSTDKGKKRQLKKEKSRLYRALKLVRRLPLFRPVCNTAADRSSSKISQALLLTTHSATVEPANSIAGLEDAFSDLADRANGLAIDDTIVPSTEPKVPVKSELPIGDSAPTGYPRQFRQKHASVWEHHESAMRRHFQSKGFPQAVYSTKLAIQKKGFQAQAANEIQVEEARRTTEQQFDGDTRTCITDFGGTAFDTEGLPSDGLWELSSTKLWHYYQEGDSWNQLGWIPGGYLRIRQLRIPRKDENTFPAEVVVEFGASTFTAPQVTVPLFANSEPLEFMAQHGGHYTKQEAVVRLRFFQGGHVQVVFPAAHLIKMDNGCDPRRAHGQLIEFAGVFMGKTD